MGRIDQETVNKILETADIVDVVSDFVKLRRSGANYKGLCPFHNERTPSFSVNKARNICKCFSCGKGGSPVNFIMELEQLSYSEALRYLARKYNIEIVEKEQSSEERQAENERQSLLAVNDYALNFFKRQLHEHPEGQAVAMSYFRHRGLSDAMIERFHLGYSPEQADALATAAIAEGYKPEYLVETGLCGKSERRPGSYYDRFRGRVTFPIHTISGRVVGFGARTMKADKSIAKYVNSPESKIYHKNLELYGLYQAKNAIARRDKAILVEGYLDVISMHQAGVENVVASSGTSLTEGQIRAIRRFTHNITLIYDADPAGIKASLRGINMLLQEDMDVNVLLLPPGDDPDSFAQSHTSTEVEEYLVANERDIISFMAEVLMKEVPANDPMGRAKVINVILSTIAYVDNPIKRQEYLSQCARLLGVAEDVLINQLNVFITKRYEEYEKEASRAQARESIADIVDSPADAAQQPADATPGQTAPPVATDAPLLDLNANKLKPYEALLLRYVVRYGLAFFGMVGPEDDQKPASVFDIIDSELAIDELNFSYPPYRKVFDLVREVRNGQWAQDREEKIRQIDAVAEEKRARLRAEISMSGGSVREIEAREMAANTAIEQEKRTSLQDFDVRYLQNILLNSPDGEVRSIASEMLMDRYVLSRRFTEMDGVATEYDQLQELVPRGIYELRNAIVVQMMAELNKRLTAIAADDIQQAMEIIKQISELKDFQRQLSHVLGDRIILPKM